MYGQSAFQQPQLSSVEQQFAGTGLESQQLSQVPQSQQVPHQQQQQVPHQQQQQVPHQQQQQVPHQQQQQVPQQQYGTQPQQFGGSQQSLPGQATQQGIPQQFGQSGQGGIESQQLSGGQFGQQGSKQQASQQRVPMQAYGQTNPSQSLGQGSQWGQQGVGQQGVGQQSGGTQQFPSQGHAQQIPLNPATGGSQQIPVEYSQQVTGQHGMTPWQSVGGNEQSRQSIETADTSVLADVLARRLGLNTQQLVQAIPQLGTALGVQSQYGKGMQGVHQQGFGQSAAGGQGNQQARIPGSQPGSQG